MHDAKSLRRFCYTDIGALFGLFANRAVGPIRLAAACLTQGPARFKMFSLTVGIHPNGIPLSPTHLWHRSLLPNWLRATRIVLVLFV